MNYLTEFKCLACARTCCELPGSASAAWQSLVSGGGLCESACPVVNTKEPRCSRCGGRVYAAETHRFYGSSHPWRDVHPEGREVHQGTVAERSSSIPA